MMDDKRLDEIRQRIEESREYGKDVDIIALEDAPALIAEVVRLRSKLDAAVEAIHEYIRPDEYPALYETIGGDE